MSRAKPIFLIVRLAWRVRVWDNITSVWRVLGDYDNGSGPSTPVAAFTDRAVAEARLRELEWQAAHLFNPFWLSGVVSYLTSHSETDCRRKLMVAAGPVPSAKFFGKQGEAWIHWWNDNMPTWSDAKFKKVWSIFDRVKFYTIIEREIE